MTPVSLEAAVLTLCMGILLGVTLVLVVML